MTPGGLDGDWVVGLLGIVMALAILARNSNLRQLSARRKFAYGAAWALIFGVLAGVVSLLRH